jgi:DNA replicative helicase MCM subunit Mcm2 (Cdc46/Mcm family)
MKTDNDELVFQCRKCEHHLYVDIKYVHQIADHDCPRCGEEPTLNWIFSHVGSYEQNKDRYRMLLNE